MGHTMIRRTMCLSGHGKLPSGSAAKGAYDTLAVTVEVDCRHGVILECDCTLVTSVGRNFVRQLLRGSSLKEDVPELVREVSSYFHGATRNALIAALKDLEIEYQRVRES
jgi:hypothetical protein